MNWTGLITGFVVVFFATASHAQDTDLPDDLNALLVAASQSDNPDDLEDTIRILALTQDRRAIFDAASELGLSGTAIAVLGNPVYFDDRESIVLAEASGETDTAGQAVSNSESEEPTPILQRPTALVSTLVNGQSELWTGKVRLGARFDTGNSDRSDYNAGLEVERSLAGWGFEGNLNYSYSRTDGVVGRDHFEADGRAERELGERFTAFLNGDYDQDARSGFDWTAFVGAGVGYRLIETDATRFIIRATPGARFIKPVGLERENLAAFELAADFTSELTDTIRFESETDVLLTEQSRADQRFTLSTALGELWALEFRVHYRYEFEPEPGFENADTQTDVSITREF